MIRVGTSYLNVSGLGAGVEPYLREGNFDDIPVSVESTTLGGYKFLMLIPSTWFPSNRLTFGLKVFATTASAGLDNVELSVSCTELPPSVKTEPTEATTTAKPPRRLVFNRTSH